MKDLRLQLQLEIIENNIDEFIDSEAIHYNECYPLVFDNHICEGLIRSYSHELLIKRLSKDFGEFIKEIEIINNADKIKSIVITMTDEFFNSDLGKFESPYDAGPFETILNIFGWYLSNRNNNEIYLEPKYSDEITDNVYKADYVFHVTSRSKLDSILKKGIMPKEGNKNRYYSHRIYLMYGYDNEYDDVKKMSLTIARNRRIFRPVLLKIDIKQSDMNFYIDPNAGKNCIYTYDYIKPEQIVSYEQIGI